MYSTKEGTQAALEVLLQQSSRTTLPEKAVAYARKTKFTGRDKVVLPCVRKEVEASASLKAVEAGVAAAIAELRYGFEEDEIEVNMEQATAFLFMVRFLCTVMAQKSVLTVDNRLTSHPLTA